MKHQIFGGVPQGSVLGPLLWLIAFDDVLRLNLPDGVEIIAYADDLAILIAAKTEIEIETSGDRVLELIHAWLGEQGL